ncbi:MAG: hypothetical protein ABFD96_01355 [Armatimonadia bacterium]
MIKYVPPPIEGAPPYVVWIMGTMAILLAACILMAHVAAVMFVYRDAQTRRTSPILWLIAASIGGWVVALLWLWLREYFADLTLEMIMNRPDGEALPEPAKPVQT